MILLVLVSLLQTIVIEGSFFNILVNSDATESALQNSLITWLKKESKFMCLSECAKRSDCLTAVYHTNDFNCYMYRDQLESSDIITSTSSNLYLKKSSESRIT